jgi:hypothetical protein
MKALLIIAALTMAGCATTAGPAPADSSGRETAFKAAKGAGKGALVCLVPTAVGAYAGPIGIAIGAYISLYCMPVGIVAGAVIGAAQ